MQFSLSTRWNAHRHTSGEAMIDEVLDMGFERAELGYDLRLELVPGVRAKIDSGEISCPSVHNYCPVPIGAPQGHPELFSLSSLDERERQRAVRYTTSSIEFAASIGAKAVVVHAGNVRMRNRTRKLIDMAEKQKNQTPKYEKIKLKLLMQRDKKGPRYIDQLYRSLEELLPALEADNVAIGIENLPTWEALPTEVEAEILLRKFNSPLIRYWHDMGHGQIRENLGLINHKYWFKRLSPFLVGMHIHDVGFPGYDHIMPPQGSTNFSDFKDAPSHANILVFEPSPGTPPEYVAQGLKTVKEIWSCE